jgi:hypothetical protein
MHLLLLSDAITRIGTVRPGAHCRLSMQRLLRDSNIVHPRRDRLWPWAALVNDRQRVLELEGYYNTIWVTTVQSDIAQEKDNISSGCHCTALAHAP